MLQIPVASANKEDRQVSFKRRKAPFGEIEQQVIKKCNFIGWLPVDNCIDTISFRRNKNEDR